MSQVNTEIANPTTTTVSLNDIEVRSLAAIPSGTISMDDLRGKISSLSGGVVYTPGDGYRYNVFNGTASYTVTGAINVEYWIVGGGGGGGCRHGGGGGAGGLRTGTVRVSSPGTATVGAGGAGAPSGIPVGSSGSPSSFSGVVAAGGGVGGSYRVNGVDPTYPISFAGDGGCGGGARNHPDFGARGEGNVPPVSPPQGKPGGGPHPSPGPQWCGAGGGGSDVAAANIPSPNQGSNGGNGTLYTWTNFPSPPISPYPQYGHPLPGGTYFCGGGGGGGADVNTGAGVGGAGGGGLGGPGNSPGTNAISFTGGGGGGARAEQTTPEKFGGNGGGGLIIVRRPTGFPGSPGPVSSVPVPAPAPVPSPVPVPSPSWFGELRR